ncbi:MAG: response regulator transcription factor [Taibaiella sp.]|nr:response regulator transcription factor [Taibaiella sp.]
MSFKCIVVDDEPHCALLIEKYIATTPGLEHVKSFYDSMEARDYLIEGNKIDITFLDIEMPMMSGIDLAREIKSKSLIIFTTGHRDFGAEAYRHNAVDYLLKPIRYEHFQEAIHKATKLLEHRAPVFFYAKETMGGKLVKVDIPQIIFIECNGNYAKIFFSRGEFYMIHISLAKLLNSLPKRSFIRVHKSYIVNLEKVQSLDGNILGLIEGRTVQIGPSFRDDLLKRLEDHII